MPYYHCVVAELSGKKYSLIKQAGTAEELLRAFTGSNNYLVSYEAVDASELPHKSRLKSKFSKETILEFTNVMSVLLSTGNTVASSLRLCQTIGTVQNQVKGRISRLCEILNEGITKGEQFHECLKRCGSSFSKLYIALVRLGEKTGTMAEIFSRLSKYLNNSKKTKSKIHSALMYPLFVLVVALIGTAALLLFIVPRMTEIFAVFSTDTNMSLVANTKNIYHSIYVLIGVFSFIITAIVSIGILRKISKTAARYIDGLFLKAPFIGPFLTTLDTLDLFFAMELCEKSGINVAESLNESKIVIRNSAYFEAVTDVHTQVTKGEKISKAFLKNALFPEYIGTWLAVGEQTGQASSVFSHIRYYFEQSLDTSTERLLNGLEPALILLVGIIILLLLIQFVLPLFSLYGAIT